MADGVRGEAEWLCGNPFEEVLCLKRARRGSARACRLDP